MVLLITLWFHLLPRSCLRPSDAATQLVCFLTLFVTLGLKRWVHNSDNGEAEERREKREIEWREALKGKAADRTRRLNAGRQRRDNVKLKWSCGNSGKVRLSLLDKMGFNSIINLDASNILWFCDDTYTVPIWAYTLTVGQTGRRWILIHINPYGFAAIHSCTLRK